MAEIESRFSDTTKPDLVIGKPVTDDNLVKLFDLSHQRKRRAFRRRRPNQA